MKSKFIVLLTLLVLSLSLVAVPLKIALITDLGGIYDKGYDQLAWKGLQKARKDLFADPSYIENKLISEYTLNFLTKIKENNDLIFSIGDTFEDTILEIAIQNPKQKFIIINSNIAEKPNNLTSVIFKEEESSFLVGYIAGKMTETNKIGFILGATFPEFQASDYAFRAGVKQANPKAEILAQYAGSFNNEEKGYDIATAMVQQGCDIIYHLAGITGNGVIRAGKERGKFIIGSGVDQNYLAPDTVITSSIKRIDKAVFNTSKDFKSNNLKEGTTIVYGLAEGYVDIAPTSNIHIPNNILNEVEGLKYKITSGIIIIPTTQDELDSFIIQNFSDLNKYKTSIPPIKINEDSNLNEILNAISLHCDIFETDNFGRNYLMLAAAENHDIEVIKILLKEGLLVNEKDANGNTALFFAVSRNSNPEIISTLIKEGANVLEKNNDGVSPIMEAVTFSDNIKIFNLLIKSGAKINEKDNEGWTPLMYAARYNSNPQIVKALLSLGANPKLKNKKGETAIELGEQNEYLVNSAIYLELKNKSY